MLVKKYQLGDIQSFGYLMGFRPKDGVIVLASENIADCFSVPWERFVGSAASVFLPADLIHKCNNVAGHSTIDMQAEYVGHLSCELEECAMYAVTQHEFPDVLLLELIPVVFQGNPNSLQQLNQINVSITKLAQATTLEEQVQLLTTQLKHSADFQHACTFLENTSSRPSFSLIYDSPYVVPQNLSSVEIGKYIYSTFGPSVSRSPYVDDFFVPDTRCKLVPVSVKLGDKRVEFQSALNIAYTKALKTNLKQYFVDQGIGAFYKISVALNSSHTLHFCFFHQSKKAVRLYQQEFTKAFLSVSLPYLHLPSDASLMRNIHVSSNVDDIVKTAEENSLAPTSKQTKSELVENEQPKRKRSVLIVEDDYLIAMDLSQMLESAGVGIVDVASNESEAIDLLKSNSYSLSLIDYNLGEKDCTEVIECLNTNGSKFVFVTGYDESIISAESPLCLGVVKKPFVQPQITRLLKQLDVVEV